MTVTKLQGDCRLILPTLPEKSIHCCMTSPPYYGLRDYGVDGQIGLEETPEEFVAELVKVFREVRRVLRDDGTLWLNLGDSYVANGSGQVPQTKCHTGSGYAGPNRNGKTGLLPKNMLGIPWRVAFALQADGWYLRQDIIWHKPNPMPESVTDRCTKAHEYIFLLSKSARYYYDHEAIKEVSICGHLPGNNNHKGTTAYEGGDDHHRTKQGLVNYAKKIRESAKKGTFSGKTEQMADTGQNAFRAVTDTRNKRSVWTIPEIKEGRKELRSDIESRHRSSIEGGQSLQEEPDGTRNKRSVWTVPTQPYSAAHFATFPEKLIEPCILAGCPEGGTVLDCFGGSGTTGVVATKNRRDAILIELNGNYICLQGERNSNVQVNLF